MSQEVKESTNNYTKRWSHDAERVTKQYGPEDDPNVVEAGGKGRDEKAFMRLDDTRNKGGKAKEDLSPSHDPCETNHLLDLSGIKAASYQTTKWFGPNEDS